VRGHTYILTCVDAFTKWAEAFPLRCKEAEPIAKVLVDPGAQYHCSAIKGRKWMET